MALECGPAPYWGQQLAKPALRHRFLKVEDERLRALVNAYGPGNWDLISSFMDRRNARQCRERYKNYLFPSFQKRPWTPEEEELLAQKVAELGPKWSLIKRGFEGRSEVNIKNHWTAMLMRDERVQKYTRVRIEKEREELQKLMDETRERGVGHEDKGESLEGYEGFDEMQIKLVRE
jgi:hypothetical protein